MPMPRFTPRSLLSDLSLAYANVRDFGAVGDGRTDDTAQIQAAIDNREGKHVLFPRGVAEWVVDHEEINPYKVLGTLRFQHAGQRAVFLAGAVLELDSDAASVHITAPDQTLTGLRIQTGTADLDADGQPITAVPSPCLLLDGADGVLLEDLFVSASSAAVLVRVQQTSGVNVVGGHLYGVSVNGNTGLVFGADVSGFRAISLIVDQTSYGIVFEGAVDGVSFENCDFQQQSENHVLVRSTAAVRGLTVVGLHTEVTAGAVRAVVVERGGGVYGGLFAGCEFGNLTEHTLRRRRVFDISGAWEGVNVLGCYHRGSGETPEGSLAGDGELREAIYDLAATATVSQSCDMFNHWDKIVVATGFKSGCLPVLQSDFGALTLAAGGISITADRIGFFGVEPVDRPATYHVGRFDQQPLARLLRGLAELGLIACAAY